MILGSFALLITLGLLVASVFAPEAAPPIYIGFVVLLDAIVFSADHAARTPPTRLGLLPGESEVFRRHSVYIRLPGGSAEFCAALQTTRWLSLLWIPWLLWNELWWSAGLLVAHFVVTASISVRMNPVGPYLMAEREGNHELGAQAAIIQDLLRRLHDPGSQ